MKNTEHTPRLKKIVLSALLISFILTVNPAKAQSSLSKGWSSFGINDLDDARTEFKEATADPGSAAEAHLGLALVASYFADDKTSFTEFVNFYNLSTDPYPYTYALWNTFVDIGLSSANPAKEKFIKQVAENPKIEGTIRAMAHSTLGWYYRNIRKFKESQAEFDKMGAITKWQATGSFENMSGCGFDKSYDPILFPNEDKVFKNKYNAEIRWFDLPKVRQDNWVDLTDYFFADDAIVFAQTFLQCASDKEVQLRIGTSGSVKAWLNDQLVISEVEERNNDVDTYIVKLKLNKGNNRLLLQIGASDIQRFNFMVRITDDSGNPIPDIKADTRDKNYKSLETKVEKVENFAESYFKDYVQKQPNSLLGQLLLSVTYLHSEKTYEARKVLLKAKEIAPKCSYVLYKLISVYDSEKDYTDVSSALEWLKANDPESYLSLLLLYQEQIDKENYIKASEYLDKLEKIAGEDETTLQKRIELTALKNEQENLTKMIDEAYKKFPNNYTFVDFKHSILKSQKNYKAGIPLLKKYLKTHYRNDVMEELAGDYFNSGMVQEGVNIYSTLVQMNPSNSNYTRIMGNIYFSLQIYTEAEKWYKKTLEFMPFAGSRWADLAKVYENKAQTEDAVDAYEKSIEFMPNGYENRKNLRKIKGDKEVFDYFEKTDAEAIYKNAPDANAWPEDNSLILLNSKEKVVYAEGTSEERHILIVKVFNSDGVDSWKTYNIGKTNMQRLIIEKVEVMKANGGKVQAETNETQVVFTSLEPGDAIHIEYKIENYLTGKLYPYFYDYHRFSCGSPILDSKFSLLIAPKIKFETRFSNKEIPSTFKALTEFNLYTWESKNSPSIKYEDKMPEFSDVADILYVSSFPDWNFVSNWYYDISSTKAKSDFEVKETVSKLFEGKESLSKLEKVKEIYNYIVNNIRYSSVSFRQSGLVPQKASTVLNTKIGDCKDVSTLFVAMCREIDVPAGVMLVDTRDNGEKDLLLPSIDFNHCIARATIDGKNYYLELTSDYMPFGTVAYYLNNALALDIVSEKDRTNVKLEPFKSESRAQNIVSRITKITIDGNDLNISKVNYKTGTWAASIRSTYRDLGKKEQEKNLLEALTGEYPNVQLNSFEFKNLKSNKDTVEYSYDYTGSNALMQVTGLSLFTLPWGSKTNAKDFIFNKKREYPYDLYQAAFGDSDVETITITIPAGRYLAETPKTIKYSCFAADYTLTFAVVKNTVKATRELKYKTDKIPLDKINEFADFYKKVVSADGKQIAIK
ncbi:MAG: transglutaminase domain-containing protein [Bacteroidota bacterium]